MKIVYAFLLVAFTNIPFTANAASINFIETGNDGVGNSFIFNFTWDTATNSVTDIQSYMEFENFSSAPSVNLVAPAFSWNPNLFLSPIPTTGSVIFKDFSGLFAFFMLTGNNNLPNVSNFPSYRYAVNNGYTSHQWFGYQSTINQVPEPTTISLLISGIFGFVVSRKRLAHAGLRQ
mgnify:CR=1 FL=1